MLKRGFERANRAQPLGARQLVDFRGDDDACAGGVRQPGPRRAIALESGMTGIDEEQRDIL
jgi:hypothetical protein